MAYRSHPTTAASLLQTFGVESNHSLRSSDLTLDDLQLLDQLQREQQQQQSRPPPPAPVSSSSSSSTATPIHIHTSTVPTPQTIKRTSTATHPTPSSSLPPSIAATPVTTRRLRPASSSSRRPRSPPSERHSTTTAVPYRSYSASPSRSYTNVVAVTHETTNTQSQPSTTPTSIPTPTIATKNESDIPDIINGTHSTQHQVEDEQAIDPSISTTSNHHSTSLQPSSARRAPSEERRFDTALIPLIRRSNELAHTSLKGELRRTSLELNGTILTLQRQVMSERSKNIRLSEQSRLLATASEIAQREAATARAHIQHLEEQATLTAAKLDEQSRYIVDFETKFGAGVTNEEPLLLARKKMTQLQAALKSKDEELANERAEREKAILNAEEQRAYIEVLKRALDLKVRDLNEQFGLSQPNVAPGDNRVNRKEKLLEGMSATTTSIGTPLIHLTKYSLVQVAARSCKHELERELQAARMDRQQMEHKVKTLEEQIEKKYQQQYHELVKKHESQERDRVAEYVKKEELLLQKIKKLDVTFHQKMDQVKQAKDRELKLKERELKEKNLQLKQKDHDFQRSFREFEKAGLKDIKLIEADKNKLLDFIEELQQSLQRAEAHIQQVQQDRDLWTNQAKELEQTIVTMTEEQEKQKRLNINPINSTVLQSRLDHAEREKHDLERQFRELQQERYDSQSKSQELVRELQSMKERYEHAQQRFQDLQTQSIQVTSELSQSSNKMNMKARELESAQRSLTSLQTKYDTLSSDHSSLQHDYHELQVALGLLQSEHSTMKQQHANALQEVQNAATIARHELTLQHSQDLTTAQHQFQQEKMVWERSIQKGLEEQNSSLKQQLSELQWSHQADLSQMKHARDESASQVQRLQYEKKDWEQQLQMKDLVIEEIKKQHEQALGQQRQYFDQLMEDERREIQERDERVQREKGQVSILQAKVKGMEEMVVDLKATITASHTDQLRSKDELMKLSVQLDDAKKKFTQSQEEVVTYKQTLEQLETQLMEYRTDMEHELNQTQAALETATKREQEARDSLEKVKKELQSVRQSQQQEKSESAGLVARLKDDIHLKEQVIQELEFRMKQAEKQTMDAKRQVQVAQLELQNVNQKYVETEKLLREKDLSIQTLQTQLRSTSLTLNQTIDQQHQSYELSKRKGIEEGLWTATAQMAQVTTTTMAAGRVNERPSSTSSATLSASYAPYASNYPSASPTHSINQAPSVLASTSFSSSFNTNSLATSKPTSFSSSTATINTRPLSKVDERLKRIQATFAKLKNEKP